MDYGTRRGCYKKEMEVAKHSSLHSPMGGTKLAGDERKRPGDVTHDYSRVYGWNINRRKRDV